MKGSEMEIKVPDGIFRAYVSRPAASPAPVIVVLQEIFGVNADIRATCDELAARGFIAVAPDLFWSDAPGLDLNAWSESDWRQGLALAQKYDLDRGVRDVAATIEAARTIDGSSGKVGVMGFCLGGLMTFLTAARTPVDSAVAYYGGNTDQHVEEAADMATPLLMHLGEEDEFISKDAQQKIKDAFAGNSNVEIHSYPGCSHAFARHTGAHYDAVAAMLANDRTFAFFDRNLRR
jgi:carboxymethylenebutenolidase